MKKRILAIVLCLCMVVSLLPASVLAADGISYKDVKKSDWFYNSVQYVAENGLMVGTASDEFSPQESLTRAMVVTVLYRLDGKPAVTTECTFDDVAEGQWYTKAVTWAAANGIVYGYDEKQFGPNDPITREQMATFMYRYAAYMDYDVTASADLSGYADENKISTYAKKTMAWANAAGLIYGQSDTILDPAGNATRAEAAAILMRFVKKIVEPECEPDDTTYTRGEWIAALAEKLEMNLDADPAALDYYYGDTEGNKNAVAIEAFAAYGFLPTADVEDLEQDIPLFHPDELATREFAAYTVVRAMGFEGTNNFDNSAWADADKLTYPDEDAIAVNYHFLRLDQSKSFNPENAVCGNDLVRISEVIDKMNASVVVTADEAYDHNELQEDVVKDEVNSLTDYTVAENEDGTYTVTMPQSAKAESIGEDETVILPANEEHPTGVALHVESVKDGDDDQLVFTCTAPAAEEVFSELDFAGTGTALVGEAEGAEGIECEYIKDEAEDEDEDEDTAETLDLDLGGSTKVPGKLKYTLASKQITDNLKASGTVEIEIPDVTCILKAHLGLWDTRVDEFTLSISEKIKFKAELKYTLDESGYYLTNSLGNTRFEKGRVELGRVPIAIGTTGLSFDIVFFYNVDCNGTASITYTINSTQGFQYKNGTPRIIFDFHDQLDFLELKGTFKVGVGIAGDICAFELMDLIGYSVEAGPAINVSFTPHVLATDTLFCGDATLYAYCTSGLDTETAIGKFLEKVCHYTLSFEHLKNDSNNPLKLKFHIENGHIVDECTFGTGTIEGYVEALDTKTPVANARIRVYQGDISDKNLIRTKYTDSEGKYSIDNLTAGTYSVQVSATGYYTYTIDNVEVAQTGAPTYLATSLMIDRTPGSTGTVTGSVTDAVTGDPIDGADYVVRSGWSNTSGEKIQEGTFSSSDYSLVLDAGNYTIEVSKDGYITNSVNIAVSDASAATANVSLNPDSISATGDTLRIILSWGEDPSDLDSHLFGPDNSFHTCYWNRDYYSEDNMIANLDLDDTDSYGPETTTVYQLEDSGLYSFYVHDFSNEYESYSDAMSRSGAKVDVYSGNIRVATFNIPSNRDGTVWHVFDFDAATGTVTPVNTFSYSSDTDTLQ